MITDYYGYTNKQDSSQKVPEVTILPTLGTHAPLTEEEKQRMFGSEVCGK
jgi:hypothetical protein